MHLNENETDDIVWYLGASEQRREDHDQSKEVRGEEVEIIEPARVRNDFDAYAYAAEPA